jgi:hypothetical protein
VGVTVVMLLIQQQPDLQTPGAVVAAVPDTYKQDKMVAQVWYALDLQEQQYPLLVIQQ